MSSESLSILRLSWYLFYKGGGTMDVKDYAAINGISSRYVLKLIQEGKIPGAIKSGRRWILPDSKNKIKLPPISNSQFPSAIANNYFVDKTLLIKDIIDSGLNVTLFARPRRFGKTFNMSMLKTFFEYVPKSNRHLFDQTHIALEEDYMLEQGKYPVVYLSFKQLKFRSYEATVKKFKQLLQEEIERLDPIYHLKEEAFFRLDYDEVDLSSFLEILTRELHHRSGKEATVIIDEYDVPITQGHFYGFYDDIIALIRNFFSGGFKDNVHLKYAFLTGVYRVAKESVFSGMNNLYVDSVLNGKYGAYFGYTDEEVRDMLTYYGKIERFDAVKAQYDGYRFGRHSMYNPWSVNHYVFEDFALDSYWGNTGSNDIIREVLDVTNEPIIDSLKRLYEGEKIALTINEGIIYPELRNHPTNVFSFLLYSGYLTAEKKGMLHEVWIPNKEIQDIFKVEILEGLNGILSNNSIFALQSALARKDAQAFQGLLNEFLLRSISFHDGGNEAFYHGLRLGLLLLLDGTYEVTSNRESGFGRYDIALKAKAPSYPNVLIEVKHSNDLASLEKDAKSALTQIQENRYFAEFNANGSTPYLIGLSFYGKHAYLYDGETIQIA